MPRTLTPASRAERTAAAYSERATTRLKVRSAAVSHTRAGRLEDWTKEYHRVSPEKPSYAVVPSMADVTARSPGAASSWSGPCRGVRSTHRPSDLRPSGLRVP